jgi:hypothetical protein
VQEIVGGRHDGQKGWSGSHFDVSRLPAEFQAEHLSVSTGTEHDPPEPVVEVTGVIDLTGPGGAVNREKG